MPHARNGKEARAARVLKAQERLEHAQTEEGQAERAAREEEHKGKGKKP